MLTMRRAYPSNICPSPQGIQAYELCRGPASQGPEDPTAVILFANHLASEEVTRQRVGMRSVSPSVDV